MKIKIEVTQDDIDQGCRWSANHCPIARAVAQRFHSTQVGVNRTWIRVGSITFKTPLRAVRFIKRFDGKNLVKPFKFNITELHPNGRS
jgi:hypothetical protein